jgi:hypothetical protein
MAKLTSMFTYNGTFREVTMVDSRTYGEHIRAARGTYKPALINDALKKSGELIKVANGYAKAIKDAFEPFREGHKEGTMWYRLVSIFRLQLGAKGYVDLLGLEGFDFNTRHPLHRLFTRNVEALLSPNKTLDLTAKTTCYLKQLAKEKADSYQQTLVVVFYDADFEATTLSESTVFPLVNDKTHEQKASIPIPDFSTTAVVALKCEFCQKGVPMGYITRKGMEIVKVVDVGSG